MNKRSRLRRLADWTALCGLAATAGLFFFIDDHCVLAYSSGPVTIRAVCDAIDVTWGKPALEPEPQGWVFERIRGQYQGLIRWSWRRLPHGFILPLWMPLLIFSAATALLWGMRVRRWLDTDWDGSRGRTGPG